MAGLLTAKAVADYTPLDRQLAVASRAPKLMQTAFVRNSSRLRKEFRDELADEPPRFKGKRRWTSAKQRAAYFASNGFGAGIPYHRTHRLSKSWRVEVVGNEFSVALVASNPSPSATFVQGPRAQRMHIDAGWNQLEPTTKKYQARFQVVLRETWRTVTGARAGVR